MKRDQTVRERLDISRRQLLLAALSTSALGCRSRSEPRAQAVSSPLGSAAVEPWGGLKVAFAGDLGEADRGGRAVVLLHGYGAEGDDLLPLAQSLAAPRTRFIVPAAPLSIGGGGQAWWQLEAADRPSLVGESAVPTAAESNPHLSAARVAVQSVLHTVSDRYAPESLCLAGFSQGAMLSLDVALAGSPAVDRVGVLSGAFLTEAAQTLSRARAVRPKVFLSHGLQDARLPFAGAENIKRLLEQNQFAVTWLPFEGGHAIPPLVVEGLRKFLFDA